VPGVSPPLQLVIFDCDGVLVDSEGLASELEVELFAEIGMPMTAAEIVERFMGRSTAFVNAAIAEHLGGPLPADRERYWEARYQAVLTERLRPIPGVAEALDQITLPVCVASSSGPQSIALKLSLCGLAARFGDHIFSATQVRHGKPAPDLFLLAADRLNADPARCAVIEDSPVGVQAGRAAGMRTFAYAGGGMVARGQLEGEKTVVFDDMHLLPELLERTMSSGR
jgi:HAD superfamily hydrolase (TIGR01509 family)